MNGHWVNKRSNGRRPRRFHARALQVLLIAGVVVAGPLVQLSQSSPQDQGPPPASSAKGKPVPNSEGTNNRIKPAKKADKAGKTKKAAARKKKLIDDAAAAHEPSTTVLPKRPTRSITPPTLTSAELDQWISKYLVKNSPKVEPATLTTDVEYVRRIYFDLAGRPPTPMQVQSFLSDHSKDKRARLIEALLASPEYARNWAKYCATWSMFHSTNENPRQVRFDMLEDWLARQLRATNHGTRSSPA